MQGIGIGFRPQLAAALLAAPKRIDFVEVVAEACKNPRMRREVLALGEIWPVLPHGVKLSLGSAEGIDEDRARALGKLARELRAPLVSEHVAFVRAGGREIGHLTELPMTRATVQIVARNVTALRRQLPDVPLLLENVARGFVWNDDIHEMDEADFYCEIVRSTGCALLLDIANLHANAINADRDPFELLASYPLDHVGLVHVAGGHLEHGFYFDTHAHPVPPPVYDLVERLLALQPDAPLLLERDAAFDDPASILGDLDHLRTLQTSAEREVTVRAERHAAPDAGSDVVVRAPEELAASQAEMAKRLTAASGEDAEAILRARVVLARKRAEEALALLPALGKTLTIERALGWVGGTARSQTVVDAMRIAEAARAVPELAGAALRDALGLRARFVDRSKEAKTRLMPWVGREVASDGKAVWAWKGFGRSAVVRFHAAGG